MNTRTMTLDEMRLRGLEALSRELGPAELIRFLQQFEKGAGDYSKDRHLWLDKFDVETIAAQIQQSDENKVAA